MTDIIFRHYSEGDDSQLTAVYLRAFLMNGKSFLRDTKIEKWRYADSPNFEPEMVQIAEDKYTHKIVGAVFVHPIEKISINSKTYLVAHINDVSCHPNYTKRGIATRLMKMAIKYMEKKNIDLSLLTAAPQGIARKKLYLKYGFHDLTILTINMGFPHPFRLLRELPISIALLPAIFYFALIPRVIIKIKPIFSSFFNDISYEIFYNKNHRQYMNNVNKILIKSYVGFSKYDQSKINWARKVVPSQREAPTYIFIKKSNKIIGGACLTYEKMFMPTSKFSFRVGIIHEIFIERDIFPNVKFLKLTVQYLIEKILRAAIWRKIGFLLYYCDSRDNLLKNSFKSFGFQITNTVLMGKLFNPELNLNTLKQLRFFIPTYVSMGFP
jgi:ribosomal protein S18 acetylase RimI-like enzyme